RHEELEVRIPVVEVFKHPTIRKLAKVINSTVNDNYSAIEHAEKKEYYPLSSVQGRMYVAQQVQAGGTAYNVPKFVPINEKIDKNRLKTIKNTFLNLIERHETLRTSFQLVNGKVVQQIHDRVEFDMEYYETGETAEVARRFMRPFDLARAPLLRVGLMKESEEKNLLMIDMHHIITDAVSRVILERDFGALLSGQELPPLKLQYKDFAHWQDLLVRSGKMDEQKKYWLDLFKDGNIRQRDLPLDYPRPAVRDIGQGDSITFIIGKETVEKIDDVVNRTGATQYMVLLAVYNIFLAKYSQQEDHIVGALLPGRSHVDLQSIIGMFVNTLPMRNFPQKEKSFEQFLEEVKGNALKTFENQDYSLGDLVAELGLQGEAGRNPLFDTVFTMAARVMMQDQPLEEEGQESQTGEDSIPQVELAKFVLYFMVIPRKETINVLLRYSTQLFKHSTIDKLAKYYTEIMEQVMEDNSIKITDITISHDYVTGKSTRSLDDGSDFDF
ncbi:MAG: hypothetical protein GY757_25655, partial [bacterium]|nr:hypothetical protein [bacterium]